MIEIDTSYTYFGDFFDKEINVKSKQNKDFDNFKYFDVRIGCSLCCKGKAFGMKTNYFQLRKNEQFLLNDIKIIPKYWNTYHELDAMYICYDESCIEILFEIFKKFSFLKCCRHYSFYEKNNKYDYYKSGIASVFELGGNEYEDPKNIKSVYICSTCYEWFKLFRPDIDKKKFQKLHPLRIFWEDFFNDIVNDLTFINDEDKEYVHQMVNI